MLPVATLPAAAILQGFGLINYEKDFHLGSTVGDSSTSMWLLS